MRYTVTIPLPFISAWPRVDPLVLCEARELAQGLGATLPETEFSVVVDTDMMRYVKWEWDE